ncbi:LppA family lipoprotein [Marmoricola endophyticus]|nr:LppA family lipoprotein [Marmoricola endophyticus]
MSAERLRAACAAALAALALAASGCSNGSGSSDDSSAKGDDVSPTEQLLARPSSEQAATMYQGQLVRVRDALKKLAPDADWDDTPPIKTGGSLCRDPFGDVDGAQVFGLFTGGGGAIPDEDWDQAIKTTAAVLEREGYDRVHVTVNKPGLHEASFYGEYGNVVTISGQRSTSIDLADSGCFMSAEAQAAARSGQ